MRNLSKLSALFVSIVSVIIFTGCGGGENTSTPPVTYSVSFYDDNLDLIKTVKVDAKVYNLADLQSGYTWYVAESNLPTASYNATQSVNFYAIPSVHEIRNETQLYNIRDDLNGNYLLMNDISLTDETLDETTGWEPVGDDGNPFTGILNGNGFKVKELYINAASIQYIGLFGYIDEGTVKNLGIETADEGISTTVGSGSLGGIAGYISGGNITNSSFAGKISVNVSTLLYDFYVGGIAGYVSGGNIISSNSAGNISIFYDSSNIFSRVYMG
ncbi:MAG: hypothetical protein LBP40_03650, partial [Campylobacteraceae bacterium]|nr:hypothetical protein [Campylobacteraceae bacterium]